jgi:hypothetical protein
VLVDNDAEVVAGGEYALANVADAIGRGAGRDVVSGEVARQGVSAALPSRGRPLANQSVLLGT